MDKAEDSVRKGSRRIVDKERATKNEGRTIPAPSECPVKTREYPLWSSNALMSFLSNTLSFSSKFFAVAKIPACIMYFSISTRDDDEEDDKGDEGEDEDGSDGSDTSTIVVSKSVFMSDRDCVPRITHTISQFVSSLNT